MNPHKEDKSIDTPIEKTVKKESIRWFIPAFFTVFCLAFMALADSHFKKMLEGYQTKQQAEELEREHDAKENRLDDRVSVMMNTLNEVDKKLDHSLGSIDNKLGHMQDQIDFYQNNWRALPPKQKDNP